MFNGKSEFQTVCNKNGIEFFYICVKATTVHTTTTTTTTNNNNNDNNNDN